MRWKRRRTRTDLRKGTSYKHDNLLEEALKLSPMERAELVENLLSSFEFRSRKTIDALWAQESEDRIDAFERGEITAIPAEQVFAEIEKNRH